MKAAPMKAVAMKYKVANTLQPFRRLCVGDKSGHGGFTYLKEGFTK